MSKDENPIKEVDVKDLYEKDPADWTQPEVETLIEQQRTARNEFFAKQIEKGTKKKAQPSKSGTDVPIAERTFDKVV